ncbi:MAG: alpha/beta fold hydrolase [Beijerinckiaceae bacterium]
MTTTEFGDIGDLPLRLGGVLREARLAYATYGRLARDGRNAILLTHGYTSSHLYADGGGASEGSWADLVGPGRAIDTDRYFVVSSNMLGSSYGSTAPASFNPATGRAYGPDFPELTLADIVGAQRRLLDRLGVRELAVVVGPSYGGFQAFAWGIEFPDFMRGLVPVVTGPRAPNPGNAERLRQRFARDPNWNGGHYYDAGGVLATMTALRMETLKGYGVEAELAATFPDPVQREERIRATAEEWAAQFDANSMLALGRASERFDAEPEFAKIRAPILYVLSRTDALFPPSIAPGVMSALEKAGVPARYVEIDSLHGHLASGSDSAKWAPSLREFLSSLG